MSSAALLRHLFPFPCKHSKRNALKSSSHVRAEKASVNITRQEFEFAVADPIGE
jgi:hypothetical protein